MDSAMPYFLVWSLSSSAWCIMQYTVYPCLVSCPFYACVFYIDNNINYIIKISLEAQVGGHCTRELLGAVAVESFTTDGQSIGSEVAAAVTHNSDYIYFVEAPG